VLGVNGVVAGCHCLFGMGRVVRLCGGILAKIVQEVDKEEPLGIFLSVSAMK
jgi:hypothetical protein